MIRKIVIGSSYKDAMVYKLGQKVSENTDDGQVTIEAFDENADDILIWIINSKGERSLWKEVPKWMCIREHDTR